MPDLSGQSLGRYRITGPLGKGGMATVYRAYDTRLGRDVALKLIRTENFAPATLAHLQKRFEREAHVLAQLNHPHIVQVLDFGEHEGAPYLVMPFIAGGTLRARVGKPWAWPEAVEMLLPVAQALAYAHQRGVLHRDVKPSNILINEAGQPMLIDFGVAKFLENEPGQTLTGTGVGVGTPEYMAPEQGLGREIDARADVYSLGIVLYELVTGRRPYNADTPGELLVKQASEPPPRPKKFVPSLPDAVEKVILKALAKKPEERFREMGELVSALEKLARSSAKPKIERDLPFAKRTDPAAPRKAEPRPVREADQASGSRPASPQPASSTRAKLAARLTSKLSAAPSASLPKAKESQPAPAAPASPPKAGSRDAASPDATFDQLAAPRKPVRPQTQKTRPSRLLAVGLVFLLAAGVLLLALNPSALAGLARPAPTQTILPVAQAASQGPTPPSTATAAPTIPLAIVAPTSTSAVTLTPSYGYTQTAVQPSFTPTLPQPSPTISQEGWSSLIAGVSPAPITSSNLQNLKEIARLDEEVKAAWFSPGDQYLFVRTEKKLYQYNGASLQWLHTYTYDKTLMNVSPDGTLAGLYIDRHTIQFIDVASGKVRNTFVTNQKDNSFAFTPDGTQFCLINACYRSADFGHMYNLEGVPQFSPDGSLMVFYSGTVTNNSYTIYVKDFFTRQVLQKWSYNYGTILSAAASQDHSTLAVVLGDVSYHDQKIFHEITPSIDLLSVNSGNTLHTIPISGGVVNQAQFLAGDTLLSGADLRTGQVRIWDLSSLKEIHELNIRPGDPGAYYEYFSDLRGYSIRTASSANGTYLLTWSTGGSLQVWGVE